MCSIGSCRHVYRARTSARWKAIVWHQTMVPEAGYDDEQSWLGGRDSNPDTVVQSFLTTINSCEFLRNSSMLRDPFQPLLCGFCANVRTGFAQNRSMVLALGIVRCSRVRFRRISAPHQQPWKYTMVASRFRSMFMRLAVDVCDCLCEFCTGSFSVCESCAAFVRIVCERTPRRASSLW